MAPKKGGLIVQQAKQTKVSDHSKMLALFLSCLPQVGGQKSSFLKKIVSKMHLGSHPKAARKRSREKRQHREARETIFSAFAMKDS